MSNTRKQNPISFSGWLIAPILAAMMTLAGVVQAEQNLDPTETADDEVSRVDVIFVLDNSGSMRTNDPDFLTREAVSNFAAALAADSTVEGRIGVVLFDDSARLALGLTELAPGETDRLLAPALRALDFSGQHTDSAAGIERALYAFSQDGRQDTRRAIVLLTDGKIDTGDAQKDLEAARWLREDLADESEASGTRIFGVAFTESADYQLMQALARRTQARYYRAFEAAQLGGVIDDVLARVAADDFYGLNLADAVPLSPATPATPPVSAAPLADRPDDSDGGMGLWAILPALLLLVGGSLLWRRHVAATAVEAPKAQLLDVKGKLGAAGSAIELSGRITRIGRDAHNEVVLDHDTVSSEHAIIEVRAGRYWLEDRRSTNGTYVGEERLESGKRVQLKGGDHIRVSDVDLMFVLAGYVPGGATVFLSTPAGPPPPQPPSTDLEDAPVEASETPDAPAPMPDVEESAVRRGPLSLLRTPEEPAAEETPDEPVEADLDSVEEAAAPGEPTAPPPEPPSEAESFRQVLDYHLDMVGEISPAFAAFIERAFDDELRGALVVTARDLATEANQVGRIQQKEYTFDRIRFAICGVPGEMEDAAGRFVESFGGFTRMLSEHLQSDSFRKDRCEILAVLSAGHGASPWVSLSIVPDDGQDPRIDLLSYEFLTDEERHEIETNEHADVSHSGLA